MKPVSQHWEWISKNFSRWGEAGLEAEYSETWSGYLALSDTRRLCMRYYLSEFASYLALVAGIALSIVWVCAERIVEYAWTRVNYIAPKW